MADKQSENNDSLFEVIKKIWLPIAGFLGAITLAYNFYKLWLGDQTTVTYFLAGGGLVLFIVVMIFVITREKINPLIVDSSGNPSKGHYYSSLIRKIAKGGIGLVIILAISGVLLLIQHREDQKKYFAELEQKLVVLIVAFEGPEEVYGLRNEIIENINADFSSDQNIEIVLVDEIVTLTKGSEYARQLGGDYLADIVIWGWYRPTENPNINIHIENLFTKQLLTLKESETFQPVTSLSELESFSFQQQIGVETSALISFLAGYIEYNSENYETALQYFDTSLITLPVSSSMFENQVEIYFYRGNSNSHLTNYELAIEDFSKAIKLNPQFSENYFNRGLNYFYLKEYELAISDYDQAIKINPQYTNSYINRGVAYSDLGEYELAIKNYNQVIQIDPQNADAYNNRGNAYHNLGEYNRAIQDFDKAIQIDSQDPAFYNNRGIVYNELGEYELAIENYDQAIEISPQDATFYYNRGLVYNNLNKFERAIEDFNEAIQFNPQYINAYFARGLNYALTGEYENAIQDFNQVTQINPKFALAYYSRGVVYQALGKTAEAEADFAKYKELTGQDAP